MTLTARLKAALDWLLSNALATSPRPGQQPAAIRCWPEDVAERRAQSDLYGRCFIRASKKRKPGAVGAARAAIEEETLNGRTS